MSVLLCTRGRMAGRPHWPEVSFTGPQVQHGDSEGPHVRGSCHGFVPSNLRRHVLDGALHRVHIVRGTLQYHRGGAEVTDLADTISTNHDIVRFDVAVNNSF